MTVDFPFEVQDPWPAFNSMLKSTGRACRLVELAKDIFQAMQVFILDIETLGAGLMCLCARFYKKGRVVCLRGYPCVASSDAVRRYLSTVMLFPAVIVGILFCAALSLETPKWPCAPHIAEVSQFQSCCQKVALGDLQDFKSHGAILANGRLGFKLHFLAGCCWWISV